MSVSEVVCLQFAESNSDVSDVQNIVSQMPKPTLVYAKCGSAAKTLPEIESPVTPPT